MDDLAYYFEDPVMRWPHGLSAIWLDPLGSSGIWPYLPITRSSFWLEYQLLGPSFAVAHGVNVGLHLLGAFALWGVLSHFHIRGAWWIALIFALHPLHVQSVAWIAERKNVVSAIFYILAFGCYWKFDCKPSWRWYGLALLMFVAALLSKTSTIMLPVLLIVSRIWFRRSWHRQDILALVPFFVVALGIAYVRIWFELERFGGSGADYDLSWIERLLIAGHVPFFYLQKLVVPYPLIFTYPRWNLDIGQFSSYLPLLSWAGIGLLLVYKARFYYSWGRPTLLGLGAFGITLFPVMGFFNNAWHRFAYVADHWGHLASLPIVILGVGAVYRLGNYTQNLFSPQSLKGHASPKESLKGRASSKESLKGHASSKEKASNKSNAEGVLGKYTRMFSVPNMICLGIALALGVLTWKQTHIYQNEETLWQDTVQKNQKAWSAYNHLAMLRMEQGEYSEALEWVNRAIELNPYRPDPWVNRGIWYARQQQPSLALADLNHALRLHPDYIKAYTNRGIVYLTLQQYDAALENFQESLKRDANNVIAYHNRGNVYLQQKQYENAIADYQQAVAVNPQFRESWYSLARLYTVQQQFEKAVLIYDEWLQIRPNDVEAYFNRGNVLIKLQKFEAALHDFNQALQLDATQIGIYHNRGMLHVLLKNMPQACKDFQQTCELGQCQEYQQLLQSGSC